MGRPAKLTPQVQKRICDAIAAGNYRESAAEYGGIDGATFYRWLEKGEAAKSGPYREFRDAVRAAEAAAEVGMVARWQQHTPTDWRACRDFLARRFPARWSEKTRKELAGPGGAPVRLTFEQAVEADKELNVYEDWTDDELRRYCELIEGVEARRRRKPACTPEQAAAGDKAAEEYRRARLGDAARNGDA